MQIQDSDSNLQWKVNIIAGGSPENKSPLPRKKAQKRLLKLLDNVQDSVFNQFLQYKQQRMQKKQQQNAEKAVGGVSDKIEQAKQNAINQAKAKLEELQQKVEAIKERFSDKVEQKVEQAKDTIEQVVNTIKQKIFEISDRINELQSKYAPRRYIRQKNKQFENWGGTVEIQYAQILYPTDQELLQNQISTIQQFVKKNYAKDKRTRGAGIRHSWGKIFSDQGNNLVSFYPYEVATGTSWQLQSYATKMLELQKQLGPQGVEHLGMIRKVGQYTTANSQGKQITKHLIKIGAAVSNDQMRRWCIENNYQYKSNVIMIEVNVCGGIGTCSHGAGIDTQTLSDYLYEVQFIDFEGKLQTINKKDNPTLILSAASSLGLLGLMVFVTLEMDALEIVQFLPRQSYKDFIIPTPKNYTKNEQRKERPEYKAWLHDHDHEDDEQDWGSNFKKFKEAIHKTYCQWFYFPIQGVDVFENVWDSFAVKTPENIEKIRQVNPKGRFLDNYPPPAISLLSQLSLFVGQQFINKWLQESVLIFMRAPFAFFPNQNVYVNHPDAVHFQRGIQNMRVRDFQVEINIPNIEIDGKVDIDYDLIQRIWWDGLEIAEENAEIINVALQMRIFKGSKATMAPQIGYDYVCSIQILRSLNIGQEQEKQWKEIVLKIFNVWKNALDSTGKPVIIRPHWGKEWDMYSEVKEHTFNDQLLLGHVRQFMKDYEEIAKLKGFDKDKNLKAFSNQIYRQLLSKATGTTIN